MFKVKFEKKLFPQMSEFVANNQKVLEESLEITPLAEMPTDKAEILEVLQQSLIINKLFTNLLEDNPRLMLKLINRSMNK